MTIDTDGPAPYRPRDRDVFEVANRMRRSIGKRAAVIGMPVEGKAWDLMVEAFLADLEPRNGLRAQIPLDGTVLESLDPLVIAGLVVVIPDAQTGGVELELSAEGRKRVQRLFAAMAREEARLNAAPA
jgi:hypothetical protein